LKIEESVERGDMISSEEVYIELAKKDDDLLDWMKKRKAMLIPAEERIQRRMLAILEAHPRHVDTLKGRSQADPFVNRHCYRESVDCSYR
jgi:phage gp29-like protein